MSPTTSPNPSPSTPHILVTGGTGYIGSHTVVELIKEGYRVHILDNLSNSREETLDRIEQITGKRPEFTKLDVRDADALEDHLSHHDYDGVIHFAALKSVGESVRKPLEYYENNVVGTLNLIRAMQSAGIPNLVFSSSCTVYGQPDTLPVTEETPLKPAQSPYGESKRICEAIIRDATTAEGAPETSRSVLLRYFNPVGADPSGLIGELPTGVPDNLMPFITQTAAGIRDELQVFGNDYGTPDGTPVRDYIHVSDLARAHIRALEYMNSAEEPCSVFNVGTGEGYSVLEIIQTFEKVNNLQLPYRITERRPGDIEQIWANNEKALHTLKWSPQYGLKEMCQTAWTWQQSLEELDR
ncbi:MAG: UDP-glucose 4-epimerase GalE [Balneolaceae bacterium]